MQRKRCPHLWQKLQRMSRKKENVYSIIHDCLIQRFLCKRILKRFYIERNWSNKIFKSIIKQGSTFTFITNFNEPKVNVLENISFHRECYAGFCRYALPENLMKLDQNLAKHQNLRLKLKTMQWRYHANYSH